VLEYGELRTVYVQGASMCLIFFFKGPGKFLKINMHGYGSLKVLEFILCKSFLEKNPYYSLWSANVLFCQHFEAYAH